MPEATAPNSGAGQGSGEEKILIAVMGITGAGKSTFIRTVTGRHDVVVGDGLQSCTHTVSEYDMTINGITFTLVDVPGFNDTNIPDGDILASISNWLKDSYSEDRKLSSILYLHKISDNRMQGSALRNLRMFRSLCGEGFFENVILTTTHWSGAEPTNVELEREHELMNTKEFWGLMTSRGSKMRRFLGTQESALSILGPIVSFKRGNLRLQEEMVDEQKGLKDTATGKILDEELQRLKEQYEREIKEIKESIKAEKDEEFKKMMEEEKRQARASLDEAVRQQRGLMEEQIRQMQQQQQLQQQQLQKAAPPPAPKPSSASKSRPSARSLWVAIENGELKTVRSLLREGVSASERDSSGRNALHKAAFNGRTRIVEVLVSEMNHLNVQDANGRTALHLAAQEGYSGTVGELLDSCCQTEIKDKNGRTPLHLAAYYGRKKTAEALLESGAKARPKDKYGKTPKELAKERDHGHTASILRSWE